MNSLHPDLKMDGAVFSCGERAFTVADVIRAAHFRGEAEEHWETLFRSLKSSAKAEETGLELDEAAVQFASEEFRLDRDLITAEETEKWLMERGLTEDEFGDYFARCYWEARFPQESSPGMLDGGTPDTAMQDLLRTDLLLSGAFDEMALHLAERVASDESSVGKTCAAGQIAEERARHLARQGLDEGTLAGWLTARGIEPRQFEEFLRLEALHRAHCQTILTKESILREISTHRVEFTQADVEMMELDSHDTAKEALFCAREDGEPLQEVARRGSYPYRKSRLLLAEIPDDWRQRLLCAAPGEVLDPMPRGDGFQIYRLIAKIEPSLADLEIRHHVEKRILGRHFAELTGRYIHWLIEPNSTLHP